MRYVPTRCPCGCGAWLVLDTVGHLTAVPGLSEAQAVSVAAQMDAHRCLPAGELVACGRCNQAVAVFAPAAREALVAGPSRVAGPSASPAAGRRGFPAHGEPAPAG